jgi:DNA polymerase (family X)
VTGDGRPATTDMAHTNADVARLLSTIATLLEIDGANTFRVRAYREGARIVESQGEAVAALAAREGALEALPGIGKDLAARIRDLAATGTTSMLEELAARIPLEVAAFTELQGLGPKRVKTLFETLGIRDRDALAAAARGGRLRDLPGFGEKVEQNVLKALEVAAQHAGRLLLARAWDVAHALAAHVGAVKDVTRVELAGSFRRRRETVGDLDLLVCGGTAESVMSAFTTHPDVADVLGRGDTKSSVRLRNGLQVDLRLVPEPLYGAALLYFTGSKEHNIELRRLAIEQGMSLNEYGLAREQDGRPVAARTEEEVYRALGLDWIPPELREARGEVALARAGTLPRLVEEGDLKADLHMHTDRSDGRDTLEAMVRAARDRGYVYCAITEHSQSLTVARGFDTARVRRSVEEIAAVRREVPGIQVLHGLEVDILADGALDLDDEGLAMLDWVVVSLHQRLDQPAEAATERVLRALDHPAVCAMGHPSGRLIGTRAGSPFDAERVFERAAERGVAMEINAQPDRLDLDDVRARLARARGVRMVIDTDAHATAQLANIRFGVFQARRAGLEPGDVLNTLPFAAFQNARRGGRRAATSSPAPAPAAAPKPAAKSPRKPATGSPGSVPAPAKKAARARPKKSSIPSRRGR